MDAPLPWTTRAGGVLSAFFDVDDDWVRPAPTAAERRADVWIAAIFLAFGAVNLELTRSVAAHGMDDQAPWLQHLVMAVAPLMLVRRRTHPIPVMIGTQVHMFVVGILLPAVMGQLTMEVLYFFGLFSGVAWARDRRALPYACLGVAVMLFGWLAWWFACGNALDELPSHREGAHGIFGPVVAMVLIFAIVNAVYFGGAIVWGRTSWRSAKRLAQLDAQAATIARQAGDLRDQAVVAERLRIARELHDVVAHHVSVMGVQAAAARRVLTRNPDAAAQALAQVEESSRSAVGEMRALLGTLREASGVDGAGGAPTSLPPAGGGQPASGGGAGPSGLPGSRAPEPGLSDIAALTAEAHGPGLRVTYELVEDVAGATAEVPTALGLSTYRIVQEALSNVRKHSTAANVSVVVRVETRRERYVEAEVLDDGRPLGATSGTGVGLLGMRERIASHQGRLDVGPRLMGGYRVRVRFPLDRAVASAASAAAALPVS